MRQAHPPVPRDRIEGGDHDDRDSCRCVSCGLSGIAAGSDNDICMELHKLARQSGKSLEFAVGESPLEDEVTAVEVAEFAPRECLRGTPPRRLRPSGERRSEAAGRKNDREPDQPHGHLGGGLVESNRPEPRLAGRLQHPASD